MIVRFRSILFVSVFQGSLAVAIIMIDGSEKPNRQLGFELQSSHVIEIMNFSDKANQKCHCNISSFAEGPCYSSLEMECGI